MTTLVCCRCHFASFSNEINFRNYLGKFEKKSWNDNITGSFCCRGHFASFSFHLWTQIKSITKIQKIRQMTTSQELFVVVVISRVFLTYCRQKYSWNQMIQKIVRITSPFLKSNSARKIQIEHKLNVYMYFQVFQIPLVESSPDGFPISAGSILS